MLLTKIHHWKQVFKTSVHHKTLTTAKLTTSSSIFWKHTRKSKRYLPQFFLDQSHLFIRKEGTIIISSTQHFNFWNKDETKLCHHIIYHNLNKNDRKYNMNKKFIDCLSKMKCIPNQYRMSSTVPDIKKSNKQNILTNMCSKNLVPCTRQQSNST